MQITLNRINLLDRLSIIERGLPGKSHFAPVEGIYMEQQGSNLTLMSNNLEMAVKTVIPVSNAGEGTTILPKRFVEIVKQLPADEVVITVKDGRAEIKSGKANFKLNCMDAENFPLLDESYHSNPFIELGGELLRDMIGKTTFCAANDISKHVFQGVMISNDGEKSFTCIASDTYRLSFYEKLQLIPDKPFEVLIPGKMLNEIGRIIKDEDTVKVYISDKDMVFAVNDFVIFARLLDGKYPDLGQAFPQKPETVITVDRQAFADTVNRARLLTERQSETIALSIAEDTLMIGSQSEEGKMSESLPVGVEGELLEQILINGKFVSEGIKAFDGDELSIEFNGPFGAVVMKDEGFKYLVLPIKKN